MKQNPYLSAGRETSSLAALDGVGILVSFRVLASDTPKSRDSIT